MPSTRLNYVTIYKHDSQVYGAGSKEIALSSPPPPGSTLEDKRVFFITFEPDNEILSVYQLPQEEVQSAELKYKKAKEDE